MNSIIGNLDQWGGDCVSLAWPILWQSGLLMTVLLAFDFLCRRKIRASIRYALWLAVLVKLCLPPALALPTGAAWWLFPSKTTGSGPAATKYVVTYDTTAPNDAFQQTVPTFTSPPPKLDAAGCTLLGYGLVSVGLLLWLAFRWWQISRKVGGATASAELAGLLDEIRARAGLRAPLRLKLVGGQMSPAVCGLFRPVILLPRVLADQLSADQLRAVLLHEVFHLRRKDVWVNCAQALLQIAYWWHPLLWLANARIRRLREEAVDDAVMLALRDEADGYAPTLLTVAKLAFSRPLMSLGLVGIMESRSALRKRIERLVNFHAPRKAGLTFLSLCGIFVFSAVALPMGPAPASAPDSFPANEGSAEKTLMVKVDPDTFIRNVKAHADWTIPTGTNDYSEILLDILRSEGVDCNPPHGIAFNTRTGEMTMQNTPDKLEIFQRVIDQLNRADGICELPLHNNFLRKSVLIEARLYQMAAAGFKSIASDLQFYPGNRGSDEWWSVAPEKFKQLNSGLESSGLRPMLRPRIQTGSGMPAEFYIGNSTNSVDFECKPYAEEGFVDVRIRGTIIASAAASGAFTNYFNTEASALNGGGIVIRVEHFDGYADSNLVAVINMEVVTNTPSVHFQERLHATVGAQNGTTTAPRDSGQMRSVPGEGKAGTTPGFAERLRVTVPENVASAGDLVRDAKLLYEMGKLDDAETKLKAALALNPDNAAARYYADLVAEAKSGQSSRATGTERRAAVLKLSRLRLEKVSFQATPLGEVLRQLAEQARANDPEEAVVNFRTDNGAGNVSNRPTLDSNSGLPVSQGDSADINSVPITIAQPLQNVLLVDALDAIVKGARYPIKYGIQSDGSVVFSALTSRLITRTFKIDPDTFFAGLRRQVRFTGTDSQEVFKALKQLFSDAGVDLQSPKAVFYSDRKGMIFVRATAKDLDAVESVIQKLNTPPAQIHIKARFMEVPRQGFAWPVAGTNGQVSQATGILNAEQMYTVMKMLEAKPGFEILAEPEVVTSSGRQTQMRARATQEDVVYDVIIKRQLETGLVLDTVATVLPDGYTIDLKTTASITNFMGYDKSNNSVSAVNQAGEKVSVPAILPLLRVQQASTHLRLWDGQTVVLGNLPANFLVNGKEADAKPEEQDAEVLVFITVTIVDPAGNRVHTDDEMPFAHTGVPPQAY